MPSRSQSGSKRSRLDEARQRLLKLFDGAPARQAAANLSAEERLKAAFALATDIEAWAKKYFPHYLVDQETQQPVDFAEFHREVFQLLLTEQHLAIQAPREHAKSTIVSFLFVLFCICHKLRRFIVLLSDTQPQATLLLNAVKIELEINDKLREDFGELVDDRKWGEIDIVTSSGIRVSARGAGQSLRGLRHRMFRPDLVVGDDLENDEAVESPERREKFENWFRGAALNLGKKCQVVLVGTILHYDALLAKALSKEHFPTFTKRFYVAVDDDWSPASVLWPGKWPLEALKRKLEEIGSIMFDREFRGRPINEKTQVFKEAWMVQHGYRYSDLRDVVLVNVTGLDPAISEKQKADFFGSVTVGVVKVGTRVLPAGTILVRRAEQDKFPFTEQIHFVLRKADAEQPDYIGVETQSYQKSLKQRLDEASRERGKYFSFVEIDTRGVDNFTRISTLSPLVENGTLRFLLDPVVDRVADELDVLRKQLLFLGKTKDDVATALEIAVRAVKERSWKGAMVCADASAEPRARRVGTMDRDDAQRGNAGAYTQKCVECGQIMTAFLRNDADDGWLKVRDCKHCGAPLPPKEIPLDELMGASVGGDRRARIGGLR